MLKKKLQKELLEKFEMEESVGEMQEFVADYMQINSIGEQEATIIIWNTIMSSVEWNKKEDLVAEQALKHLKQYSSLLSYVAKSPKSELALLIKIQEYCFDNMSFMNVFHKIVVMLYKCE